VEAEVPAYIREALDSGSNPLRTLREWRGYGITALAQASGIETRRIAELEASRLALTRQECEAIGAALGISADLLPCEESPH
jgi:hypothetical protein